MMKYSFYNHLGSSPHSYLIYKSELSHVYKYESNIFASYTLKEQMMLANGQKVIIIE